MKELDVAAKALSRIAEALEKIVAKHGDPAVDSGWDGPFSWEQGGPNVCIFSDCGRTGLRLWRGNRMVGCEHCVGEALVAFVGPSAEPFKKRPPAELSAWDTVPSFEFKKR